MARNKLIKQYTVLGFTEGLIDMIGEQRDPDEEFMDLWRSVKSAINRLASELRRDGLLSKKDVKNVGKQIDILKRDSLKDCQFTAMTALSFCMDLLVEQLRYTKGRKKAAFERVWETMRGFDKYFDPDREYEEDDGAVLADDYRELNRFAFKAEREKNGSNVSHKRKKRRNT